MNDNHFTFSVSGESIKVHYFSQQESRGDSCLMLLQAAIGERWEQLSGKTGWVSYLDHPPELDFIHKADLRFCTTKVLGEASPFLPFPCPHALRWPQIGLEDADGLLRSLIANNDSVTSEMIFWLGADTHPSRVRLAALSQEHPGMVDAEVMSWDRSNSNLHKSQSRHVSLWDHRLFKYVIDCPGYGYSGRLKWLLASGRPAFVVERRLVEHWHDKLMPWVHFIPVKEDLSDLLDSRAIVEKNPKLYESIGRAAKRFAEDYLVLDAQLTDVIMAFDPPDSLGDPDGSWVDYEFVVDRIIRPSGLVDLPGIFLEIGAFLGRGTMKLGRFLETENTDKPLLVIDPFEFDPKCYEDCERGLMTSDSGQAMVSSRTPCRQIFESNVRGLLNIKIFRGRSNDVDLSPFLISFAIVDGGKSDGEVRHDFRVAWRQLVSGGVLAFHNYGSGFSKMIDIIDECLKEVVGEVRRVEKFESNWVIAIVKN